MSDSQPIKQLTGRVVVCPVCRDAYLDTGAPTPAGLDFAKSHGPECQGTPGLSMEDTTSALTVLVNLPVQSLAH